MGANPRYFAALAWCLSGALGALAGVLLASGTVITPTTGSPYLFLAFAAAVLGGFGSVAGAVVGALILGLGESFFGAYVSLEWPSAVPFVLLILVLLLKPSGLFGGTVNRV
jgi:branched-chain amino acid transport system permease protein